MFCLLENNYVIDGPYAWNQRKFQMILQDDHDIAVALPYYNSSVIVINDDLKIVPAYESIPSYNPKIEQLSGKELTVNDDYVTVNYTVLNKDLETVKTELKSIVAQTRYNYEIGGTYLTIDDAYIKLYTDRESRNIFAQALQLGAFEKNWKFDDVWVILDQDKLTQVVTAISNHIQSAYDWEKSMVDAINNSEDLLTLDAIDVFKGA